MEQTISSNGGTIKFSYRLGCGEGLPVTVASTVDWISAEVDESKKEIIVTVQPNTTGEAKEGTVKILIDGFECLSTNAIINFTQESGGDDCPTHSETIDCTDYSQEEVVSIDFHVTGDTTVGCNGGTVTVQPYVTYKNYCLVTSNTVDCHGTVISSTTSKKYDPQGNKTKNVGGQSSFPFEAIDCTLIPAGETRTNEHTFNASYGGKTTALTVTQTCQSCKEPEPETREYEFDVDFRDLRDDAFTYVNSGDYSDQTHTISVSSRTKTTSETNWSWADIDYEFSEGLLPIGAAGFKLTQKSSQGYVREYEVSITGTPENHEVQNIRLVITQRDNPHATERVKARYFNFAGDEPDYIYNEIRPFIVQVPYEQNRSTLCYLFFKSYGDMKDEQREIKVNKKVTFFESSDDVFVTRISDGQCAGTTNTKPGEGSKPYILSGESSNYEPSYRLSDISSRGVFIREISQQCMQNQFTYDQNHTNLSFKVDGTTCNVINGYKGSDGFPDSCSDDINDVCLIIPRNQDIEMITADTIIRRTSQVIFDDGDSGPVTVSVYEDGVAFVDSAETSVATVNERFQNITQFVNTVYPSGYNNEIQACTLFNFEDLEEHCINDIVIEDGELIRRDESIPSPTRAMHIEQDEENN